jgi:hypothetical protein
MKYPASIEWADVTYSASADECKTSCGRNDTANPCEWNLQNPKYAQRMNESTFIEFIPLESGTGTLEQSKRA